ncbi:MAG: hypothetical protein AAF437_12835 [Pseudomonadota bacterium]
MLLRRITKHVKDQNWFAVALDFFIVVVGILIAFQITNWNDLRQSHAAERALVERLNNEFSTLADVLEQRLVRGEQLVSGTAELITLVRDGDEPQNKDAVKSLLLSASRYNAPVASPTTFSDALQSGRLSNLRDDTLRDALNGYVISTDWWATVDGPVEPQIDPNSTFNEAITWGVYPELADAMRQRVIDYDWALVSEAERELVAIYRKQTLQAEAYRLELVEVERVLQVLNTAASEGETSRVSTP